MRTMIRGTGAILFAVAVGMAPSAVAQDLPPARTVVDQFVAALGGRDALMQVPGYRMTGTLAVPAQGISGEFVTYSAPPNLSVLRATIPGLGETAGGFDGTVGWSLNPAMGPSVLEDRMLDQMRQQSDFYSALHNNHVASMETVDAVDFEGSACYKLKITTSWGEEHFEFFDRESGLMIGSIRQSATPMGEIESTTIYTDYRDVNGLRYPMKVMQRMMGMEQVFEAKTIEPMAVPDSVFALPAEIRALVGS